MADPEYISIKDALPIFKMSKPYVTIAYVKHYIVTGQLKAFVPFHIKGCLDYPSMNVYYPSIDPITLKDMVKLKLIPDKLKLIPLKAMHELIQTTGDLSWLDGDIFLYSQAIALDKDGNEVRRKGKGEAHIDEIMLKRKDVLEFTNKSEQFNFEILAGPELDKKSAAQPTQETDEELCKRLKLEGLSDRDIAKRVKQSYPKISSYRIGNLLPANSGAHIEKDSISKRGRRLLE